VEITETAHPEHVTGCRKGSLTLAAVAVVFISAFTD